MRQPRLPVILNATGITLLITVGLLYWRPIWYGGTLSPAPVGLWILAAACFVIASELKK